MTWFVLLWTENLQRYNSYRQKQKHSVESHYFFPNIVGSILSLWKNKDWDLIVGAIVLVISIATSLLDLFLENKAKNCFIFLKKKTKRSLTAHSSKKKRYSIHNVSESRTRENRRETRWRNRISVYPIIYLYENTDRVFGSRYVIKMFSTAFSELNFLFIS